MAHEQDHVERVKKIARFLAEREGANTEVVLKAAELHDIARNCEDHAVESARIAEAILRKQGFEDEFINAVKHAIEAHSFSGKIEPKTLEAKVLSDADKLDAIGAIGIARAFIFSGKMGRGIEETMRHFEEKLLKLRDRLYTETAKRIAKRRHEFLKAFYDEMKRELSFEDLQ